MAIAKDEIEKYIFDPENPKQCKTYKLLLRIAKRDNAAFFSPEFLQYFFKNQILTYKFDKDIWDKPDDYDTLSYSDKINLYKEQLSFKDFEEHIFNSVNISSNKLFKYPFFRKVMVYSVVKVEKTEVIQEKYLKEEEIFNNKNNIKSIFDSPLIGRNSDNRVIKKYGTKDKKIKKYYHMQTFVFKSLKDYLKKDNDEYHFRDITTNSFFKDIILNDENCYNKYDSDFIEYDNNLIIFSKKYFDILKLNITRSSIFITLKENIQTFLEYENNNVIKPIFLKKIEDVDILLNVLQQDIQKDKYTTSIEKEEITTIDKLAIENFYSIDNLQLTNLKDKKEIYIVGENGDGKTLLLQSIAIGLAGVKEGDVFNLVKSQDKAKIEVVDSKGVKYSKDKNRYDYIFAYGASRYNNCQTKEDETGYLTLFENRYDLKSPVKWLQYLDHNEKSGKENIIPVVEAKELLNKLLNKDVNIDITPDNVTFEEKGSIVNFEQLSAGYQGVITIICDLIDRLYKKQPYCKSIKDFRGVVLIDEIELHLHPKWKYDFMKKLRDTFPLIQFIVTTHSPTVILGASKEAVFYKIYKDNGKVTISNQIENEGYTNNSLVSSPLFDMETITSREYSKDVSSDDYIYEKIHQVVAKKIKESVNIDEEELLDLIDKELDKI